MQKDKIKEVIDSQFVPQLEEIRTISLPCMAKLEVINLLKAIEIGAKGVAVWGCVHKDCLYPPGSRVGRGRVGFARRILKEIGREDFLLQYFDDELGDFAELEEQFNKWLRKIFALT